MKSIESKFLSHITPTTAKRFLTDFYLWGGSLIPFGAVPLRLYTPNPTTGEFPLDPIKHPLLFGVTQRVGDFPYTWFMSSSIYNALSLIPKIPEKVRLGAAFVISSVVTVSVETGLTSYGFADHWDIPAGLMGPVVHLGLNLWLKRRYKDKAVT